MQYITATLDVSINDTEACCIHVLGGNTCTVHVFVFSTPHKWWATPVKCNFIHVYMFHLSHECYAPLMKGLSVVTAYYNLL